MPTSLLANESMLPASLLNASALMELDGVLGFFQSTCSFISSSSDTDGSCMRATRRAACRIDSPKSRSQWRASIIRSSRCASVASADVGFASDTMPSELAGMFIALANIAAQLFSIVKCGSILDAASCVTVGDCPSMSLLIML